MEEMYEVLRFIEHGANCRQSMDCVEGTLLIHYLRDNTEVGKTVLMGWFRELAVTLDQYHRCRSGQNYRYLNPYSVIVSEEGRLMLLNLDSPENEFVMKKMQGRAVREHFVKPVFGRGTKGSKAADVFALGKVMQFVLACSEIAPPLKRREEIRLSGVIGRCIGERKQYEDIRQVIRDMPAVREGDAEMEKKKIIIPGLAAVLAAAVILSSFSGQGGSGAEAVSRKGHIAASEEAQAAVQDTGEVQGGGTVPGQKDAGEEDDAVFYAEQAGDMLESYLLENTAEGNRRVILLGRELETETLRSLASAYEREEMAEEAVLAYGRLLEIEESSERIENAGIKKMKLEAGQGQYAKAVLTGERLLERVESSEAAETLMLEYARIQEQEENEEKGGAGDGQEKNS